ncbi:MAG: ABC transporter ATP-binding protein [Candidatus Woesearchaeota archaeon]
MAIKHIYKYVGMHRKVLFFALFLATINQVFSLLDPQIFRLIIDNYAMRIGELSSNEFMMGVGLLLLAFIGVAFVSRTAKTFQDYYLNVVTQKVGTKLYADSVAHTFSLPYSVFEDRTSGEILLKLQKARDDTKLLIENSVNILFFSLVGLLVVLGYAYYVHWSIGLAYTMMLPIIGWMSYAISSAIKQAQKDIVSKSAALASSTTETVRNVELVKSLGLEEQEIGRLNNVNEQLLGLELQKVRIMRRLSFIQGTVINGMRALLMFLMLLLIFENTISVGEFFTLLFYSFFVFNPLSRLGEVASSYQQARASLEKLEEVLNIPPKKKDSNAIVLGKIDDIVFDNVSFSYSNNGIPSVNNLSFSIKSGEHIGIVGLSGSGKSTVIKLLLGLYEPTHGAIKYNGHNNSVIDYDMLRRRVGFVSQDTQLFAGTIRENLLFVNPDASDDECMEVLRASRIGHLALRSNNGLSTIIGEGGLKLSGGEKQRLSIARALLRKPDIIVFDEATSSLDSDTESSIIMTIEDIRKKYPGIIMISIAHRLSTVMRADRILVLDNGSIGEDGNHDMLIKKKGLYSALWNHQTISKTTK